MINGIEGLFLLSPSSALHDINFFQASLLEQGVKLLNNRNLYHLDDSESIIFSRAPRSIAFVERQKKNLVESFCVWFLSARDYSR
jgi:hypothetical protein